MDQSFSLADADPEQAAEMPPNITLMDATELLCDGEHRTPPQSSTLAPLISPVLTGLLPRS